MRSALPPPPLPPHAQQGTVASTLRGLAPGQRPSEVWRGAAFVLLRLNAKEGEALAHVFEDEAATDETRLLVLDLLAGAGTFEAQVILRRLLALAVARRSARTFANFVQRLAIVECPDGPTLRFLMSVYAESRNEAHDIRAACAYALGAAAGQALTSGELDTAVRASDVLRRDLLAATSIGDKCALLTALGNAGVASDVVVVARFTQDLDAPVRSAAALAFRKLNAPEARANLLSLLADREPKVAHSALIALSEHKLDDGELEVLAEMVLAGRTPTALGGRVLRLIVAQRPRMTAASGRLGAIENALRLLLGRVEAAGATELAGSGERVVAGAAGLIGARTSGSAPAIAAPRRGGAVKTELLGSHAPPLPPALPALAPALPALAPAPPSLAPSSEEATVVAMPSAEKTVVAPAPANLLAATVLSAGADRGATVLDQPPLAPSGAYRIVNPGDGVEQVRARMRELGLDPNARTSMLPLPPPRRAMSESSMKALPLAAPAAAHATQLQPFAIVRR